MRYREMAKMDLAAVRQAVSDWLDAHPDGLLPDLADDLKRGYPDDQQADMAIVLRGMGAAEVECRASPAPEIPPDPAAPGGAR